MTGINLVNPMLRGWVNYFAVGHSSECFSWPGENTAPRLITVGSG
jgi:Group II intron, maturase-specific domain